MMHLSELIGNAAMCLPVPGTSTHPPALWMQIASPVHPLTSHQAAASIMWDTEHKGLFSSIKSMSQVLHMASGPDDGLSLRTLPNVSITVPYFQGLLACEGLVYSIVGESRSVDFIVHTDISSDAVTALSPLTSP